MRRRCIGLMCRVFHPSIQASQTSDERLGGARIRFVEPTPRTLKLDTSAFRCVIVNPGFLLQITGAFPFNGASPPVDYNSNLFVLRSQMKITLNKEN